MDYWFSFLLNWKILFLNRLLIYLFFCKNFSFILIVVLMFYFEPCGKIFFKFYVLWFCLFYFPIAFFSFLICFIIFPIFQIFLYFFRKLFWNFLFLFYWLLLILIIYWFILWWMDFLLAFALLFFCLLFIYELLLSLFNSFILHW